MKNTNFDETDNYGRKGTQDRSAGLSEADTLVVDHAKLQTFVDDLFVNDYKWKNPTNLVQLKEDPVLNEDLVLHSQFFSKSGSFPASGTMTFRLSEDSA